MILNYDDLAFYWGCLPIGKENAVGYDWLCSIWNADKRTVRAILHDLSVFDNGDDYVLIRSSSGVGFYRTSDPEEIEAYRREVKNRGRRVFQALKKADRVLGTNSVQMSVENNIRQYREEAKMKQSDLCRELKMAGLRIAPPELSKIENGVFLPTPRLVDEIARILGCKSRELVLMSEVS